VEDDTDLKEVRALGAVVYGSVATHGYTVDQAVELALEVAEKLVTRSVAREKAKREVEERSQGIVPRNSLGQRPRA
jgi:hypothetical protein